MGGVGGGLISGGQGAGGGIKTGTDYKSAPAEQGMNSVVKVFFFFKKFLIFLLKCFANHAKIAIFKV